MMMPWADVRQIGWMRRWVLTWCGEQQTVLMHAALSMLWLPALGWTLHGLRPLCVCLPDGSACDQISVLPPPYLHTTSNQIMAVGMAWKQGQGFSCASGSPHVLNCFIMKSGEIAILQTAYIVPLQLTSSL